jgi:hypothetical protein
MKELKILEMNKRINEWKEMNQMKKKKHFDQ